MQNLVRHALSAALFSLAATFASADTMLSNLTLTPQSPGSFNVAGSNYIGTEFLTGGSASAWNLDSATLELGGPLQSQNFDTGPILYNAYLYNSSNHSPTTVLGFLGSFDFTNQTANYLQVAFDPATPTTLRSNAAYWILVDAVTTCPAGEWEGVRGQGNLVAGDGWQFETSGLFYGSGNQISGRPIFSPMTPCLQIQATVESVPEPATFALVGLGGALLKFCHWPKRLQVPQSSPNSLSK